MKTKVVLILIAFLALLFVGCGVDPAVYDKVNAELEISRLQVAELQEEIRQLKNKYELVGETPTETAENIVKHYHETHIYSKYDFFVCSDMALDVWDMLKAQGINALIQIGNVETGTDNVSEANHAWVLAEVSQGEYLALETTGGYAVWDNSLYYKGWSFDNPKEYKRFVELRYEYDTRANLIKQMTGTLEVSNVTMQEAGKQWLNVFDEMKGLSINDPLFSSKLVDGIMKAEECGESIGKCKQLVDSISQQLKELENIGSEMHGLVQ